MERIILLLILSFSWLAAQNDFIFWAELSNKNLILFHQSQNISPTMIKSEDNEEEYSCEIAYDEGDYFTKDELGFIGDKLINKQEKLAFLNRHKDQLQDCFIAADVQVRDYVRTSFFRPVSESYIKVLPLRFRVDFGLKSALIFYLRKK